MTMFVPRLPRILKLSRKVRDSEYVRSILIVNEKNRLKPLFSWYNPNEPTWIPQGWTQETKRSLEYYFDLKNKNIK